MTTTNLAQIIETASDDALRIMASPFLGHGSSLRTVRNADGSLGELTDTEREFGRLAKAEFRRRFLGA